jgi:superfamily II DNA or RNA helicase
MRVRERRDAEARLHEAQVIVATGKYIGEGFDLPRLDTLFLALPIAWKGTLALYAGRIHREADGKQEVTVYDYLDTGLPMLERMFQKREKGYKAMGYQFVSSGQPRLL